MSNNRIRNIVLITGAILMVPLIAMQFTEEVAWTLSDFIVAAVLLLGTGAIYELIMRTVQDTNRRAILTVVLILVLVIIWIDLAVGIFNIPGFSGS